MVRPSESMYDYDAFVFSQGGHEVPAAGITAVASSKATLMHLRPFQQNLKKQTNSKLLKLKSLFFRAG